MIRMRELMDDPIYRAYMKRIPLLQGGPNPNHPWQIWVETPQKKWLTGTFGTYAEVWPIFVKKYRERAGDPTIVSRRAFFAPPGEWYKVKVRATPTLKDPHNFRIEERWRQTFKWDLLDPYAEWCGRCRRPVEFRPLFETHHALARMPVVSDEDNMRCPICGIRRSAQPTLAQMIR